LLLAWSIYGALGALALGSLIDWLGISTVMKMCSALPIKKLKHGLLNKTISWSHNKTAINPQIDGGLSIYLSYYLFSCVAS
jgi:hypothetical protein